MPVTVLETSTACNCAHPLRTWDADGNEVQGKLGERGKILTIAPGARFDVDVLADTERIDPNASRLMILRLKTDSQIQPLPHVRVAPGG
ncbi:MAG: hypothetical protein R3E96_05255 [Planctomycetota bacterium]